MAEITGGPRVSRRKVATEITSVVIAGLAGWLLQPWYHRSEDATSVLVTVFSILAGFLAAVMAIVANDRVLRGRNWRQDTYYLGEIRRELLRHSVTFYVYLAVLVLAFLTSISSTWPLWVQRWTEHGLLFFATLGIFHSFQLPKILSRKHVTAMEKEIRRRREKETGAR
ncbi:hypothetical protein [Halomonas sp.]|uniref:hypothetical protein n=1 Tax=Halomonas sp. TaxID=1486246 RepID=UPI00298ECA17|nr:hypothetical protein [Halomonas sp.]MDW7746578.1 hypothetical protein [Halomonas sp.]